MIAQETFTITDLGTLGGSSSLAFGVNDQGDAVGDSGLLKDSTSHAFLWREGTMIDLGTLTDAHDSSIAFAINNRGQVVGQSSNRAVGNALRSSGKTPMVSRVPHALPTLLPGGNQGQAIGISDRRHIIAGGLVVSVSTYSLHAVLWTPTTSSGDMTPPTLLLPATIVVDGTSPAGATVAYSVSASDNRDPNPVVICSPPSGNVFPLLVTNVSCVATDDAGNSASGTFQVVVLDATHQLQQTIDVVASYALTRLGTSLSDKLQLAMGFSASGDVRQACGVLTGFLNEVRAQSGKALSVEQATELTRRGIRIRNVTGC